MRRGKASARRLRKAWRTWSRRSRLLPPAAWLLVALAAFLLVNAVVQVARKPTELLGVLAPSSAKRPADTWAAYGPLFLAHGTDVATPELLAALVQVESAGDPLARTYWRLRWSANPFQVWAPASSAVGLLQITDGTFEQARELCVHDGVPARAGAWWDPSACWFNALYFRTVPSHAIEMTAASLHVAVATTLGPARLARATPAERRRLAALIHLCGPGRAAAFAARGFRPARGERCGDHDLAGYLARVDALAATFARLAREDG